MTFQGRVEELENFIFRRMGEAEVIGLSVATVEDGRVTYKRGIGFSNFEKGTSVTPRTTFCIGSVNKSFTALAVMQLVEKGLLSLDDPIDRYVFFKARPMGEPILVRHLLSHSSGLASLGYAEATLGAVTETYDTWFPISSPRDLLIFMGGAEEWALARPGERHAYLNEGYILLGSIIESVSGQEYTAYVRDNILKPLGMDRSTFLEEDVKRDPDVATPYVTNEEGVKVATRYPYGQMLADGGLMSNALDMARFASMLLNGGELDGKQLARPETIQTMMEPKIRTVEEPLPGTGHHAYGYGMRIKEEFMGGKLVYHSGSVFGSSGYMGLLPDEGVGVVILANGGYFLEDMGEYALALLLGRDPMEAPYLRRTTALDSLAGTYRTFKATSDYKVERSGGLLNLTMSFGRRTYTVPLAPVDLEAETKLFRMYGVESTTPVEFVKRDGDTYLVFDRNLAKKVSGD
ncbi:MAG TPA: serine hydrolase [Candidatus Bathyarchaeia archaeon]